MFKAVIAVSLFLAGLFLFFITSSKSKFYKGTFSDNQKVDNSLSSLTITGIDFMEYLFNRFGVKGFKMKIRKKAFKGSFVIPGFLYLGKIFEDPLCASSFTSGLHELKHVLDTKWVFIKAVVGLCFLFAYILLFVNHEIYNFVNGLYLALLGLFFLLSLTLIEIHNERRAIKFVPEHCNSVLSELGLASDSLSEIDFFMSFKARNTLVWYGFTTVQYSLFYSTYLVFMS